MKKPLILLTLGALLLVPAASAHVTVNPNEAEAGSFSRFAIPVPNDALAADTITIVVELPEGLSFVSFQPKPGGRDRDHGDPRPRRSCDDGATAGRAHRNRHLGGRDDRSG